MMDSVIAVFSDQDTSRLALQRLVDGGRPTRLVRARRVMKAGYRGLDDAEASRSLMYHPRLPPSAPVDEDTGIHIVVVKVTDDEDAAAAIDTLGSAGATGTIKVEATPPFGS